MGINKSNVMAGVKELQELFKDDMWIKSPEGGRDVLDEDKYQQAFPRNTNRNKSWTTEATRAVAFINKNHLDLADMITEYDWTFLFPNMVATEKTIKAVSTGSVDSPHGALQVVYKELQAAAPIVANRKLTVLRTCLKIDTGTWVVAEISLDILPSYCRRLPSGCLIERISNDKSKVIWVEHTEVDKSLPNQMFCDHLIRSGFAFGAERMAAWLERFCDKRSHMDSTHSSRKIEGPVGFITKILLNRGSMDSREDRVDGFGDCMVRRLFENISPNDNNFSTLLWSVTGPEDLKVHVNLYNSSANFEVAGAVVAFHVKHSPSLCLRWLEMHANSMRKLCMPRQYSTGGDPANNISASMIGSSDEMLIKEVNVNRSGSLVVWSTVSKKAFDLISHGKRLSDDSVLISGFSITTDGHTTATNTGGSVITLVLRTLVEGGQPLQEKRELAISLITTAIYETVVRVKEALDKQRPPSPRERLTDEQNKANKKPKFLTYQSKSCKKSFDC
ncbi:hypothetical protein CTI12_AA024770 [Artemisia annua]|uniref:START domain-containing protein n=1 Tax=Artemisia annua TaxID=35608 RepID=A0A2U1QIS7_ARTAN|nr:hypothetical protein CTI12_AA024770 [Artemisia annua]